MKKNNFINVSEKKGKTLIAISFCLSSVIPMMYAFLKFRQNIFSCFGGIIMMICGILQYKGFKLLKNDVLGNLPVWEAVSGGIIALISACALLLQS